MKRLVLLPILAAATPSFGAISDFIVYNYDRSPNGAQVEANNNDLAGRLFIPTDYNPNTPYKLVVNYHGLGEVGYYDFNDNGVPNELNVNSNINNLLAKAKADKFILYCPQGYSNWAFTDILDMAVAQTAQITKDYNIDQSHIYATGLSLGGGAVIDTIGRYPHIYAAAVAICPSDLVDWFPNRATRYSNLPLWIHQAQNDGTVNYTVNRARVQALRTAKGLSAYSFPATGTAVNYDDGILRYSERTTGGHGIWSSVFNDASVYTWMYAQTNNTAPLAIGEKVNFDLGYQQLAPSYTKPGGNTGITNGAKGVFEGESWNSTSWNNSTRVGVIDGFAETSTGRGTRVSLAVTDTFETEVYAASAGIVRGDGYRVTPSNPGQVQLSGLTPGSAYNISVLSMTDSASGSTRLIIGGVVKDVAHLNNLTNVTFETVIADSKGYITLDVQAAPGSNYGYLNDLSVTAVVPEPTTFAALLPALAGLAMRRRR